MNSQELKKLTSRQQEIFDYIVECLNDFNTPPTRAEIASHFGFKSANAAEDHLKALAKKGYVELKSGMSRGIHVNPTLLAELSHSDSMLSGSPNNSSEEPIGLAVIGDVAAGEPMLAQEHIQQYVNVEAHLFSDTADYLLKVKGDSMINVGIFEQDLLAIKKTDRARNDQIIVARIDNDVTVKRYVRDGQHISLIAENDDYNPIEVDLEHQSFAIEGVVVGLIRKGI